MEKTNPATEEVSENHLIQQRIEKLKAIRDMGIEPYPYNFSQSHHAAEIKEKYSQLKPTEETTDVVSVAGRLIALRNMGKAAFMQILDRTGKIQGFVSQDSCPDFDLLKKLDLGDIIGLKGIVFCTKTGEITVRGASITLLCKTLRPLPEKFHGLKDPELRYRMRYVDLIVNPDVREIFEKRAKIIRTIREFLEERDFLEADTPCLQPIYGGAAAKPFITHLNALNMQVYMRISNELYLKRLLVGGFERVFEFARDFRNEGIDRTHNPEFTQVEIYQAYADYNDMMKMVEELYEHICLKVLGTTKVKYGEHELDFKAPWKRMTMKNAIKELGGIDVDILSDDELNELSIVHKLDIDGDVTRGKIISALFETLCESKLIQPTFIIQHPKESTPLCKADRNDPDFVERFEPFAAGFEIANAYSELNDPIMQKRLLEGQAGELRGGSEEAHPMDDDFIRAMEYGMPPAGGVGIGIDRMCMLLTGQDSIREVLFFPFMKPEQK